MNSGTESPKMGVLGRGHSERNSEVMDSSGEVKVVTVVGSTSAEVLNSMNPGIILGLPEEVLENILSFFEICELKMVRHLSGNWNREAVRALSKKQLRMRSFVFHQPQRAITDDTWTAQSVLPHMMFDLQEFPDWVLDNVLSVCGTMIWRLAIRCSSYEILKKIFQRCQNLRFLDLYFAESFSFDDPGDLGIVLPHLESLRLKVQGRSIPRASEFMDQFGRCFVRHVPNVTHVECVQYNMLTEASFLAKLLVQFNTEIILKVEIVDSMGVRGKLSDIAEAVAVLSTKHWPNLQSLKLWEQKTSESEDEEVNNNSRGEIIRFITSVSGTLKFLDISGIIFGKSVNLPEFKRLLECRVDSTFIRNDTFFTKFPVLRTIMIENLPATSFQRDKPLESGFGALNTDMWRLNKPWRAHKHLSSMDLFISSDYQVPWALAKMFPNLRTVRLVIRKINNMDTSVKFEPLFRFFEIMKDHPRLESLDFAFEDCDTLEAILALMGIQLQDWETFRSSYKKLDEASAIVTLPSLRNITGLKFFSVLAREYGTDIFCSRFLNVFCFEFIAKMANLKELAVTNPLYGYLPDFKLKVRVQNKMVDKAKSGLYWRQIHSTGIPDEFAIFLPGEEPQLEDQFI